MQRLPDEYWDRFKEEKGKFFRFNGIEFENLIEELLVVLYGKKWNRTKKSHDNNRDFWIMLEKERVWAECKNYESKIALDTLAPTLVMAQIYDVNTILFFSRSSINPNAKDKILTFGEKVKKKVIFYDADVLDHLIITHARALSKKYRPKNIINSEDDVTDAVQMYFFQSAF